MLTPRKMKFRKQFRGKTRGPASRGLKVCFGQMGIKTLESGWITARQIEAARRAMTRYIKREGQIWIRIFPDKPVSQQPNETGMGGGKGGIDHFVAPVKAGKILFEIGGVANTIALEALRLAQYKLPLKTAITSKH